MIPWQTLPFGTLGNAIALSLSMASPWILLKTKWCREYQALENLGKLGITAYLPRCAEKRHAGFRKTQQQPLFPGYIFAQPNGHALPTVYGVAGAVMFGANVAHVDEEIIAELKRRETSAGVIDLSEEALSEIKTGDQVKIVSGPFANLVGELCKLKNGRERAIVLLREAERIQRIEVAARDLRLA